MNINIKLENGTVISCDNANDAVTLVRGLGKKPTATVSAVETIKHARRSVGHKTQSSWTQDELRIIKEHISQSPREISRYIPRHTYQGVLNMVFNAKNPKFMSKRAREMWNQLF